MRLVPRTILSVPYQPLVETCGYHIPWDSHETSNTKYIMYGAPFVKILYLTDLAQKLLSLRIFSYLYAEIAISVRI